MALTNGTTPGHWFPGFARSRSGLVALRAERSPRGISASLANGWLAPVVCGPGIACATTRPVPASRRRAPRRLGVWDSAARVESLA